MSGAYTGLILGGPSAGQLYSNPRPVLTVAIMPKSFHPVEQRADGDYSVRGEYGVFVYIFASFAGRGFWVPSDIKDRVPWILDQLMANYRPKLKTGYTE